VFSLLAEARQRIAATITAIEAKRDFWLATVDLKAAIAGGGRPANRHERGTPRPHPPAGRTHVERRTS
jgi:outer membrane protein TolC